MHRRSSLSRGTLFSGDAGGTYSARLLTFLQARGVFSSSGSVFSGYANRFSTAKVNPLSPSHIYLTTFKELARVFNQGQDLSFAFHATYLSQLS